MMTSSYSDRGMQELKYAVIPTGSALQRDIQLAGHVTTCQDLESEIASMSKPNESHSRNEVYNALARKLNRHAANPNGGLAAWETTKTDVLSYFDSRLPVYADPEGGRIPSKGYILDTMTRKLYYFDGSSTKELCSFIGSIKGWQQIQNMLPALFKPSPAVMLGFASNYVTLKPDTSINMMHLVRQINPKAQFDKFVETEFLPLYANLAQHAAVRSLLVKHKDTRTLQELTTDIVRDMLGKISGYMAKLGAEGKGDRLSQEKEDLLVNMVQYLNSGDYNILAASVAKYDSAWVTNAANWFFNDEIDQTLNIIKEIRKSGFLDSAIQQMLEQQYGKDRSMVVMEHWRQQIFGRKHEHDGDDAALQGILETHYGEGQTLEMILQTKLKERGLFIQDMGEEAQSALLAEYDVDDLDSAAESKVRVDHDVSNSKELKQKQAQALKEAQEAILESVQQSVLAKISSTLLNEIANEVTGAQKAADLSLSEDASEEIEANGGYVFESHIVDFESSEKDVNAMWDECRVTKEAFKVSLVAMAEKLEALQAENQDVELPSIPLAQDLLLEDAEQEEKTIIEHIKDSISRLQEKVDADKSKSKKTFYQTDCASLQNSINKILAYQFVGESTFMLTEEQRSVYNEVGAELTDILNATEKKPKKDLEVISSVIPVREEIHRLIAFHNSIREQLTGFQQKLRSIDQGTFFNDIQKFIEKGAALDKSQLALQMLLDNLVDCQDVEFNVLAPENEWQRKVCAAVKELTSCGTGLVDELQDVLLNQQIRVEEGEDPKPREYKKVTPKKDATYAGRFGTIMEGIHAFAETLHAQETSRLATYFEEKVPLVTESYLSMFSHTADRGKQGGNTFGNDFGSDLGSNNGRNGRK